MKFPTHYLRPADGQVLKNNAPWLVYGWQTGDGKFTAVDGRKYPADLAAPIGEPLPDEDGAGVEP